MQKSYFSSEAGINNLWLQHHLCPISFIGLNKQQRDASFPRVSLKLDRLCEIQLNIILLRFCQIAVNAAQVHMGTNVTSKLKLLQNISLLEVNIAVFPDSKVFFIHCQSYEAGSGRGNCCPLTVEAGMHTTNTDPYPISESHSDSKKWHWQRQRHLSVHISLSASLKPCSPQLRWLASPFSPFFSLSLPWMPTSGESEPAKASSSWCCNGIGPRSPHHMLSEPHIYN